MDTDTAARLIGEPPLVRAYRDARATGTRWVTPGEQQARLDRKAATKRARQSRRTNRRRG